ncbi:MIP/aquaporin family protein [Streptomyces sp. NBC_00572]|uniref:aquaporin n=1 Tax=Streptomyces sp. NBC_00572 TaxID=2903664 RepID=UPI002251CA48|nr:MIP/aquaporin family protein [Streptomyces sp. NBC_00572]MCX4986701.1 aquaporin family protein [Streptomyces sp. NBC_00572]
MTATAPLGRRVAAEFVGTGALVAIVVGSGIQATRLSQDVGVQLLANSVATVFGLGVLIALLGPVSGAHFNPVVTLATWATTGRRSLNGGGRGATDGGGRGGESGEGPHAREVAAYVSAQTAGGIGGAVLADAMFAEPLVQWSGHDRSDPHLWLGEVVATAGLILLVLGLPRARRAHLAPVVVASYIGSAYWFTSSTSFANPAVTVGRAFTDTFAGISPGSVPMFVVAQLGGLVAGLALYGLLFGRPSDRHTADPGPVPEPPRPREGSTRP